MREGTRRREGRAREGLVATPSREGNRRLPRRRCASLETCGGPEGGTREPLTGSLPAGPCGLSAPSGLRWPEYGALVAYEKHSLGALPRPDASVRRGRAEGGPGTDPCPRETGRRPLPIRCPRPVLEQQAQKPLSG